MAQTYYNPQLHINQTEFFTAPTKREVFDKMDSRKAELARSIGATAFRRRAVGRNTPCPCGSGTKFKRCCIDKCQ